MTVASRPNRGDPPSERACPAVRIAGADGVRERHVDRIAFIRRMTLRERIERGRWHVRRRVQLTLEMRRPIARGKAGTLEPLLHAMRGHELAIVPELLTGRLQR